MTPESADPTEIGSRPDVWPVAVVTVTGIFVIGGLLVSGGNPVLAVGPPLAVALLFGLAHLPLRWSATALVFLLLALDVSTDAAGLWGSPLVHLGDLLGYGFSRATGLPLAGFEVLIGVLMIVAARRRGTGSTIDGNCAVETASIMRYCVIGTIAGCAYAVGLSLLNGHGIGFWKARYLLHIPLFFLVFQTAFRKPEDFRGLAIAVVAAAQIKAVLAAYVQLVVAPSRTGGLLACATNHGDSILFGLAVLILVIPLQESWTKRAVLRVALLAPLPLWGMILNGRRLVWAILAMAAMVHFLATSWRPWKTRLVKVALIAAPLVLGYLAVGWNNVSAGGIFMPIAKIRTMLDPKVDHSTLWRERENWNIAVTFSHSSLAGIGLGGEYVEHTFNDDLSSIYADYKGWPHNTVLGVLLLTGLPGFFLIWTSYLVTVFLALRSDRMARNPFDRSAASVCIVAVVACLAVAWGDNGPHFIQFKLAAAGAMALAAKLAVATGAWPQKSSTG